MTRIRRIFIASLMSLGCIASPELLHAAEDSFTQGVELFKSGQYKAAAERFEAALKSGNDSATLHYNLAVSYYKTEKYAQAQQHFLAASKDSNLAAISHYNLGLVAERQHKDQQAREWFTRSHSETNDAALKSLAAKKLGLPEPEKKNQENKWSGFAIASVGHDSNVSHVNEDLPLTSSQSDNYIDIYAMANYQLGGDSRNGEAIKIGGSLTDYADLDPYDYSSLDIGIYQNRDINTWRSRYGAHLYRDSLDGNSYQQRVNLQLRGDHDYTRNQTFRAQYDLSLIDDLDSNYSYLAGTRQRFKIQNTTRLDNKRVRISYTLELNDREDLQQGSSYSSFSATRHSVDASLSVPISEKWSGRADLNYRTSSYNDATVVAGISQGRRDEDRSRATLRGIYQYSKNVEIEGMLRRTHNSSNVSSYNYTSDIAQLSLILDF